jgi:hypothetical protein
MLTFEEIAAQVMTDLAAAVGRRRLVEALGGHLEINAVVGGQCIALTATDSPARRSA